MSPLFAVFIIGAIISFMLFYKRKRAEFTLPVGYKKMLEDHVAFYRTLDAASKINFENKIQEFLGYIVVTGVKTEVSDLDRMLVAASGVIPIFGFPKWHYYNLKEVLLFDDRFNADNFSTSGAGREVMGMVGNGAMQMQMILSKPELYKGFSVSPGQENTGIHEFVHLLDKEDGDVDGLPEALLAKSYTVPWLRLVAENIRAIQAGRSDINIYGSKNNAEFFAVAAEYFFEKPKQFEQKHPELYEMLTRIFNQRPVS
jgi:Mlc titration factor MtfA (ptsG expression regulator)